MAPCFEWEAAEGEETMVGANRRQGGRRGVLFLMLACGCSSSGTSGTVAPPSGLHARARQIDHYLVNYGAWPSDAVDVAHRH